MYLIKEKFFRLGNDSEITDDDGNVAYKVDGKVLTLRDRLVIADAAGREVAQVHRRLLALRPTYVVKIGGQRAAVVRKRWLRLFRDRYAIDVPGPHDLTMKGSLLDHEFTISRDGDTVATVSKRWISIHDTYAVDVVDGEDALLILAVALALDLAEEREKSKNE
jgi:uncharacterized protein YxjI